MVLNRILKPALFIYECLRVFLLICIFAFLLYGTEAVSCFAFAAPVVVLPIMALFIWIDADGYKAYIPLFIAGKSIGLFSLTLWFTVSRLNIIAGGIFPFKEAAELLFILGDLLALAAIIVIYRNSQKALIKQETIREEKQCELFQ